MGELFLHVGVWDLCFTHLCDFLPSAPSGPDPQSWAWMMKVYSFCDSQSTSPRALSWPSPDVPFSTTASNGDSSPWMLNAHISPGDQAEGMRGGGGDRRNRREIEVNHSERRVLGWFLLLVGYKNHTGKFWVDQTHCVSLVEIKRAYLRCLSNLSPQNAANTTQLSYIRLKVTLVLEYKQRKSI